MSDEVDIANDNANLLLSARISQAADYKRTIQPTGKCHNCDTDIPKPKLFCDNFCAEDWEKYNGR